MLILKKVSIYLTLSTYKHLNRLLLVFCFAPFFVSCGGGTVTTLPEAPPPYPNFPVPYQPSSTGSTLESASNSFANSETSTSENFSTANPLNSWRDAPSALTPSPNYARFTVHAKSNLWLLIQDPSGNELDWLKLQAGEKVPISHIGALTLTCSSGKEIDIFNKAGKKMDLPGLDKPGISIIRLN